MIYLDQRYAWEMWNGSSWVMVPTGWDTSCDVSIQYRRVWDASQIKQPGWNHVEAAFIEGAREARANPEADDAMFRRAADGYTKRVFEEVDPVSEAALRTASWTTNEMPSPLPSPLPQL